MKFSELPLRPETLKALHKIGYQELTPIQEATFTHIVEGKDLVGLAETGSGKTSACGVPLAEKTDPTLNAIQVLVLVPTRELALQYVDELSRLTQYSDIACFALFGGFPMDIQEAKLRHGVHILVATPGRLIDSIYKSKCLSFDHIQSVVLDEADEMLNMGFWEDVEFILSCIINKHQTLLFSATMPKEILQLIESFLEKPEIIELNKARKTPQSLDHYFQSTHPRDKKRALLSYLEKTPVHQSIIFCNSRHHVSTLYKDLKKHIQSIDLIHGGLDQNVRTSIFERFKSGRIRHMIATDVAGRGLDFSKVTHVINYDMPRELENYIHRTGRAGRMGRQGIALSFVTHSDLHLVGRLLQDKNIHPQWIGSPPTFSKTKRSPKSNHTRFPRKGKNRRSPRRPNS